MRRSRIGLLAAAFMFLALGAGSTQAAPANCPYEIRCSIRYMSMSQAQQKLFDIMYDAIWDGKSFVGLPVGTTQEDAQFVYDCLNHECPELIFTRRAACRQDGARCIMVFPKDRTLEEQREFICRVARIAASFTSIQGVHEYVCRKLEYRTGNDGLYALSVEPYDVLRTGKGNCAGYAHTMTMLCHFAGIECSYVLTDRDGGHAFNVAKVGSSYTLVDTCWDDFGTYAGYEWFGLSSEDVRGDICHQPWKGFYSWVPEFERI